jgi:hypothetical protein
VGQFGGAACWRGSDLAHRRDWIVPLRDAHVAELVAVVDRLLGAGTPLAAITLDDVALPQLGPVLADVLDELLDGRGFVLLRGLPVDALSPAQLECAFWCIGLHLGIPIPQNDAGEVLVHVRDAGLDFADPTVRGYQTNQRLDYHSDSTDVVGLLCVQPAKAGGISTIVSSTAIHDELERTRPDLAALLREPWWFDRRKADTADGFFTRRICAPHGGRLYTHYGRAHIESAVRGPQVPPLRPEQLEALDAFDALANAPELVLDMAFQAGDMQFLDNYKILHARTDYEDWPEPERRRDLLRLWLTVRRPLDLPDDFTQGGITNRATAFGA